MVQVSLFASLTRNNGVFAPSTAWFWVLWKRQKLDLFHWINHMGNEIRTVRFPLKMHRGCVSFCFQCYIHFSLQVWHCNLTDWICGDFKVRFLHLRSSKCSCFSWLPEELHRNNFVLEFCLYLIDQSFNKSVLYWYDKNCFLHYEACKLYSNCQRWQ